MGFASSWLKERSLFPQLIEEAPSHDTEIIAVIPSYDEPEITLLLDSLLLCDNPGCSTEIIIIINAPPGAHEESLSNNYLSMERIKEWKEIHPGSFFRTYVIDITPEIKGEWSVGMARKTGMDEAVRRFDYIDKPEGIILSLDADCRVKKDYFAAVYNAMHGVPGKKACSVYFEHPLSGDEFPAAVYKSITLYELHLRYYFQALLLTGFPYVHHTVGSAIAVKANQYVRSGGMNRRMAGEDFYFVQKLVPAGGYFNLYGTTVFPSPRSSTRVPFGTGVTITKLSENTGTTYYSYNLQAFMELKKLFDMTDVFFNVRNEELPLIYNSLPGVIKEFITISEFEQRIIEIKENTSGLISFKKRFFNWFNMFKIVKYLNFVHGSLFEKVPVQQCAAELFELRGISFRENDPALLLDQYRRMECED